MKPRPVKHCLIALVTALFSGVLSPGYPGVHAQLASDEARLGVQIRFGPIAQLELPEGTAFELHIPSRAQGLEGSGPFTRGPAPHLDSAQVPFTVSGNARVTVSAAPGAVLDAPPEGPVGRASRTGPTGKALSDTGAELPYYLCIELPESGGRGPSSAGLGNPCGTNPGHQATSRVDTAQGPISGVVHVVPGVMWGDVASRSFDNPGIYRGEVQVTITAREE